MDPAWALPEPPQGLMVPALTLTRGRYTVSETNSVRGPLLVGVMPEQDTAVLDTAITLARALHTTIAFVYVDPAGFRVQEPGGGDRFASIDPDVEDDDSPAAHLESLIGAGLAGSGIGWTYRLVRGEAADELAQAAEEAGAFMIVVGARRQTVARRMENLLTGSVAAHLAHHQPTPVLVVPAASSRTRGGR